MVAEIDVQRSVLKHIGKKMDSEKDSSLKKWFVMRLRRDGFAASLCQTSWPTTFGCPGGEYEYIEVVIDQEQNRRSSSTGKNLIIDIDFKSQFEVARPTSSFKELIETLPEIFVGDGKKLSKIITLMCSEAKHSLRERGLHIPPWRTNTYMQSKWFSNNLQKIVHVGSSRETRDDDGTAASVMKVNGKDFVGRRSGLAAEFSPMRTRCC